MKSILELKCKKLPNIGKFEVNKSYNGHDCWYDANAGERVMKIKDNYGVYVNFFDGDWKNYFDIVDMF